MLPELMLIPTSFFLLSFRFLFIFSMRVGKEEEEEEEGFGEMSDPAIKLFGREIAVPEDELEEDLVADRDKGTDDVKETNDKAEDLITDSSKEAGDCKVIMPSNPNNGNGDGQPEPGLAAKESSDTDPKQDQVETDASGKDHKVLKKPDKILPCPRCNSLDTKFCYYNNYNINQPRHFCKNCQRYWTAGGTMRNVPVGAGRRKNKHSASHYRQLAMTSEGMLPPQVDISDPSHGQVLPSVHHVPLRPLKVGGPVLKPIEAMVNILHLGGEQNKKGEIPPVALGDNEGEPSCSSSMKVSECMENDQSQNVTVPVEQNGVSISSNRLPTIHSMPCYPAPPWAYPWNPAWNNVTQDGANPNSIPWHPPTVIAAPAVCAPAIPFPFIPAPFWGCMPGWTGGAWAVPMVGPNVLSPTPSTSNNSGCSGNNSPTLGKHSRDTSVQVEEKPEKSLWVPKTLRIDDPDEAAKSSIWATLGIKPDRNGPAVKGSIFKAFQSKSESKDHPSDTTQVFHANPAASSRSQNFQEST